MRIFAALTFLFIFAAQANNQVHACWKRVYTESHMAEHPGQHLNELYTFITREHVIGSDGEESYTHHIAQIMGRSGKDYYGSTAGCSVDLDRGPLSGTAQCGVDCDGGNFDFRAQPDGVAYFEPEWFPLHKNSLWSSDDPEHPLPSVLLSHEDGENKIYRVERAPVSECQNYLRNFPRGIPAQRCR